MNSDTPAILIRSKDLDLNCVAFRECVRELPKPFFSRNRKFQTVDIRYGLGGWACVLKEEFPQAVILGFEQDQATLARARKPEHTKVRRQSFTPSAVLPATVDLLLADFNNLTALKMEPLLEALSATKPKAVIFTDVACSKLHLNYRSYGLREANLGDYWSYFPLSGYRLVRYARSHHHASTALFVRERS